MHIPFRNTFSRASRWGLPWLWVMCGSAQVQAERVWQVAAGAEAQGATGEANAPFPRIQLAVDAAQAGDVIEVAAGVYPEQVTFARSGEAGRPITLRGRAGASVILDGAVPLQGWTRCAADDAGLTRAGLRHLQATQLYRLRLSAELAEGARIALYENGRRARTARWPDQEFGVGLDTGLLQLVPEEGWKGQDRIQDPVPAQLKGADWAADIRALSPQALDEYWQGASAIVWLRKDGNYTETRKLTGYRGGSLQLSAPLRRALQSGDAYSVFDHPHALTSAGEYTLVPPGEGETEFTLYYWPHDPANLAEGMRTPQRSHGIFGRDKSHLVLENLQVRYTRAEGIYFRSVAGTSQRNDGLKVRGCRVEDVGASGIYLQQSSDTEVSGCVVWRTGGRGIFVTGGHGVRIVGNTVGDTSGTCISFYGVHRGQIIDNRIHGAVGVHANGSSCYLGCHDILVARNIYYRSANATFQNIRNLTVYANVWDGHGEATNLLAIWGNSRNSDVPTGGNLLFLHNTLLRADRNNAALFQYKTLQAHNNLIGGAASWGAMEQRSHNGWTALAHNQTASQGWKLGEGSWQQSPPELSAWFRQLEGDAAARDYRPTDANPGRGAARPILPLLRELGVTETFPDFDFTLDLLHRPRGDRPSMGALE